MAAEIDEASDNWRILYTWQVFGKTDCRLTNLGSIQLDSITTQPLTDTVHFENQKLLSAISTAQDAVKAGANLRAALKRLMLSGFIGYSDEEALPDHPAWNQDHNSLCKLAASWHNSPKTIAAAALLCGYLVNRPHNYTVWFQLGLTLRHLDETEAAFYAFDKAITHSPEPQDYAAWQICDMLLVGKPGVALQQLRRVDLDQMSDPRFRVYEILAEALTGELDKVLAYWEAGEGADLFSGLAEWVQKRVSALIAEAIRTESETPSITSGRVLLSLCVLSLAFGAPSAFGDKAAHLPFENLSPQRLNRIYLSLLANGREGLLDGMLRRLQDCDALVAEGQGNGLLSRLLNSLVEDANPEEARRLIEKIVRLGLMGNEALTALLSGISADVMSGLDLGGLWIETNAADNAQAEEKAPAITVVVPCFNAKRYLADTLESIRAQSFPDFECIIVDDASSDGSLAIAQSFANADPRFRIIQHKANAMLSAARNSGIRAARGEYICFLDSDDTMLETSLEERIKVARAEDFPLMAGVACASVNITEGEKERPSPKQVGRRESINFVTSKGNCPFTANQPMIKASVLRQMGGFDEALPLAEDYDLWLRIMRHGYVFLPVPVTGVTYRARQGSMVRQEPLEHLRISAGLKTAADSHVSTSMRAPGSELFLHAPHHYYQRQMDFARRALEFAGMALAAGEPADRIAEEVAEHLATCVALRNSPEAVDWIVAGIGRYSEQNRELNDKIKKGYWLYRIHELYGRIITACEAKEKEAEASESQVTSAAPRRIGVDPGYQQSVDVVIFPHKDYHLDAAGEIVKALSGLGVTSQVVDISAAYRDEGVRSKAKEQGVSLLGLSNFMLGYCQPKLALCFNDWDPVVRGLFSTLQSAGVHTMAIVEGVQDFLDVDTKRLREPYRHCDEVLLAGEMDKRYFATSSQATSVASVPRIVTLRQAHAHQSFPISVRRVLINSNFSYNVLTEERDAWVRAAVRSVRRAGLEPLLSRHPADEGRVHKELQTSKSLYEALQSCDAMIGRFGTGILEAMAMKKHVVYFRPETEQLDYFDTDTACMTLVQSEEELTDHLRTGTLARRGLAAAVEPYLNRYSGEVQDSPYTPIAEHLAQLVETRARPDLKELRAGLQRLDRMTAALSDGTTMQAFFAAYGEVATAYRAVTGSKPNEELLSQRPISSDLKSCLMRSALEQRSVQREKLDPPLVSVAAQ